MDFYTRDFIVQEHQQAMLCEAEHKRLIDTATSGDRRIHNRGLASILRGFTNRRPQLATLEPTRNPPCSQSIPVRSRE